MFEKIREYSYENKISMSRAANMALEQFFKEAAE